jgi:hypothetical protein
MKSSEKASIKTRMRDRSLILKSPDDFASRAWFKYAAEFENSGEVWIMDQLRFVAGQRLSGSLVPWRAPIVTPHCTRQYRRFAMRIAACPISCGGRSA